LITWFTWTLINVLTEKAVAVPAVIASACKRAKGVVTSSLLTAEIEITLICIFASHTVSLEALDAITLESEEGISTVSKLRTIVFFKNAFISSERDARIGNSSVSAISFWTKAVIRSGVILALGGVISVRSCYVAVRSSKSTFVNILAS